MERNNKGKLLKSIILLALAVCLSFCTTCQRKLSDDGISYFERSEGYRKYEYLSFYIIRSSGWDKKGQMTSQFYKKKNLTYKIFYNPDGSTMMQFYEYTTRRYIKKEHSVEGFEDKESGEVKRPLYPPKGLPERLGFDHYLQRWISGPLDEQNRRHGKWETWYGKGEPGGYVTFVHGKKEGPSEVLTREGQFLYIIIYKDDYPVQFCIDEGKCVPILKPYNLKLEDYDLSEIKGYKAKH